MIFDICTHDKVKFSDVSKSMNNYETIANSVGERTQHSTKEFISSSCILFFYFPRLPEDEQLLALPVMLKSLRMFGVGECHRGVRLPEDSEVLKKQLRFA